MRHSTGAGSRTFHNKTRWSSRNRAYREKNTTTKTGYTQVGADRDDSTWNVYPKQGLGETGKTGRPFGSRNYRKSASMATLENYKVANFHLKKENNAQMVKVWLRNLPPSYSQDDFLSAFESAGRSFSLVAWCQFYPGLPASRKETLSSAKKGFAYLAFQSLEDALEFENEYSGLKLRDSNNSVEYGVKIFRALFPKVPSKYRYRDPLVASIFDDVEFLRFERALNGIQDEEDHSEGNLNISNATTTELESTGVDDKPQSLSTTGSALDNKNIGTHESDFMKTSDSRYRPLNDVSTKQRYSKRMTQNFSQSRYMPRYRVKRKTEQGEE